MCLKFALAEFSVEAKFKMNFSSEVCFSKMSVIGPLSVCECGEALQCWICKRVLSLLYSQKLKEKKLQAKKNKLEQKKQEKGQWNLIFFFQDLVLFPNWSPEGFVPPSAPSILNTWIGRTEP